MTDRAFPHLFHTLPNLALRPLLLCLLKALFPTNDAGFEAERRDLFMAICWGDR